MKRQIRRKRLILFCLIAVLAVGIISPAGDAVPGIGAKNVQAAEYRVTTTGLNLRTGPGNGYAIILAIPSGRQVQVLSKPSAWYRVSYAGKTGYVYSPYLRASGNSIAATATTSGIIATKTMAEDLFMRSSKTTATRANIIGVVKKGQKVSVRSIQANMWYYVTANGKTGYIRGGHFTDDTSRMKNKSITPVPASKAKKKYTNKTMAEALKMRSSMNKNANNVIKIIPKGAKVKILAKKADNWYRVQYQKVKGYIKGGHFTDDMSRMGIGDVKPFKAVTKTSLNMRSSMSTAGRTNVMTVIPQGRSVTVTAIEENNWLKITYNGLTGYVRKGYFK